MFTLLQRSKFVGPFLHPRSSSLRMDLSQVRRETTFLGHFSETIDDMSSEDVERDVKAKPFDMSNPPEGPDPGYSKKHRLTPIPNNQNLFHLHCIASGNNTRVMFTTPEGNSIKLLTGGSTPSKFRHANRATYEAGFQCAVGIFRAIEDRLRNENFVIHLIFKGYGQGREAMKTALLSEQGEPVRNLIRRVTDKTPIKIGGTRAKKARRL